MVAVSKIRPFTLLYKNLEVFLQSRRAELSCKAKVVTQTLHLIWFAIAQFADDNHCLRISHLRISLEIQVYRDVRRSLSSLKPLYSILAQVATSEYINVLMQEAPTHIHRQRLINWGYYILRNFLKYEDFDKSSLAYIIMLVYVQKQASELNQYYLTRNR